MTVVHVFYTLLLFTGLTGEPTPLPYYNTYEECQVAGEKATELKRWESYSCINTKLIGVSKD